MVWGAQTENPGPTFAHWAQVRILPTSQRPSAPGPPDPQVVLHSCEAPCREGGGGGAGYGTGPSSGWAEPNCRTSHLSLINLEPDIPACQDLIVWITFSPEPVRSLLVASNRNPNPRWLSKKEIYNLPHFKCPGVGLVSGMS